MAWLRELDLTDALYSDKGYLQSHDVKARQSSARPLSVPPSQYWDGNDGSWSTFNVQVGTPAQTVRLLPGTSSSAGSSTWYVTAKKIPFLHKDIANLPRVLIPQGCSQANPGLANCNNDRGWSFISNASSTWSTQRLANNGLFTLYTVEEGLLGLTGNAYYGFDTLNLGLPGSGLPSITNQVVAGIATNDFWLGSLGLSPIPFNFTDLDDPIPSMMGTLRNQSIIPSSSWAYTAGAFYKSPPSLASLTLGGYDTTQFATGNSSLSFSFGNDLSRDLLVSLTSITYNTLGSSPLLAQQIDIFIDSLVTELWLPVSVCKSFESAFNLVWNDTAQLYLVNNTTHTALLAQNPTFTSSLGQSGSDDQTTGTVSISLPYAAFDLNMTEPMFDTPTRYFPLKQAQNFTQYTLGRTLLQEAYVIADYDRKNFSVHQAAFPATSVPQNIVSIVAPIEEGTKVQPEGKRHWARIVIASVVGFCLLVLLIFLLVKRRQKRHKAAVAKLERLSETHDTPHDHASTMLIQADDDAAVHELDERQAFKSELEAHGKHTMTHELDQKSPVHEMGGPTVHAFELEAPNK